MSEVPVPQNGSSSTDSALACAKLTMHRAIFEGMADGWKKGFLRGRRSEKVLLVISVSFKPKIKFFVCDYADEGFIWVFEVNFGAFGVDLGFVCPV